MSCPSINFSLNPNYYQIINGHAVPTSIPITTKYNNGCRKVKKPSYPSFAPVINNLSVNGSVSGVYSLVYIYGINFLPPVYGTTYVNFGPFKQLPITFYSNSSISFVVPLNALAGIYNIVVVNIYNSNFSPAVNQSYAGNQNYSNSLPYQINGYIINNGTYTITSNAQYNTIITFTANSSITFYQNYIVNYIVVGGGGGGGSGEIETDHGTSSGGGGGGGVTSGTITVNNNTYNLLIGNGGLAGPNNGLNGNNGSPSYINIGSDNIITANGGFGGQTGQVTNYSGYGGASGTPGSTGGQGGFYDAGPGNIAPTTGTLGGGGGGETFGVGVGANGSLNLSVPLYGTAFGAGGGGGSFSLSVGNGGNSNAGNGSGFNSSTEYTATAGSGIPNTGGGGGGGGYVINLPSIGNGGNGGSGVVILYFNT